MTPPSPGGVAVALAPTTASFNILCNGYARAGRADRAVRLLLEMRRAGCAPDVITYTTLVKAASEAGQLERARELAREMGELGMPCGRYGYNHILAGMSRQVGGCGAERVNARDQKRWGVVVTVCCDRALCEGGIWGCPTGNNSQVSRDECMGSWGYSQRICLR